MSPKSRRVLGKPPRCSMQLDLLEYDFTLQNQQTKLAANAARTPMLSSEISV